MSVLVAAFLGVVQGLAEFLPISSTGHLIIVNQFISLHGNFEKMFDVVIQLGAILAVVVYYRKRLLAFMTSPSGEERMRSTFSSSCHGSMSMASRSRPSE